MVGKIIYSDNFISQLDELSKILYTKKYFSFIEDVDFYIDKIYDYLDFNIDKPISKISPEKFKKYGERFIKYKANSRTTWYIFFDKKDNKFLVNYILNNHSHDFPELM
ncbi:hypothetical protein [Halpernia frigidisoli]|uniref:Type II toxin-antitoxin system RelE/ParE family toxin n=1 Tax=Halpernia frigidisoli TaxID=1125876 RepID=A0A1I3F4H7_9FLAO|nr:hypothetical protein [Halpernia frigidisoli]SFI06145.1 hypothetical protein SAMN05443292_1153 [Halpernia frigidisoli]